MEKQQSTQEVEISFPLRGEKTKENVANGQRGRGWMEWAEGEVRRRKKVEL